MAQAKDLLNAHTLTVHFPHAIYLHMSSCKDALSHTSQLPLTFQHNNDDNENNNNNDDDISVMATRHRLVSSLSYWKEFNEQGKNNGTTANSFAVYPAKSFLLIGKYQDNGPSTTIHYHLLL